MNTYNPHFEALHDALPVIKIEAPKPQMVDAEDARSLAIAYNAHLSLLWDWSEKSRSSRTFWKRRLRELQDKTGIRLLSFEALRD